MNYNTPVLFLIFNRPDLTEIVFNKIKEIRPYHLFIAADGPRDVQEKELCEKTRRLVLDNIDWECKTETLIRDHNLGCKIAVSSAIDWFFSKADMGIILEDDCLPDTSFFTFCQEMLQKYKDDERVMHICGSNYTMGLTKDIPESYYFSKYAEMWGWATWKRAWLMYELEMKSYDNFEKENRIKDVFENKRVQRFWSSVFTNHLTNQLDTWDFQWIYSVLKNYGLCIVPMNNLISNIGCGIGATHIADSKYKVANQTVKSINTIMHPSFVLPNNKFDLIHLENRFLYKKRMSYVLKTFFVKVIKIIVSQRLYTVFRGKRILNPINKNSK